MAVFRIPYLVVKPLAAGGYGYYWQPSPALTKKGWTSLNLGASPRPDDPDKQDLARRRNDEVDAWRAGGAKPRAVKKFTRRETFADLVGTYKEQPAWTKLGANTQATYNSSIAILEVWATDPKQAGGDGNMPVASISRESVRKLRDALMKPQKGTGLVRHHRAHSALTMLRILLQLAEDRKMIQANPAARFDLEAPPPRQQVWQPADVAAFEAAARHLGYPSIAFAVELGLYSGQRLSDLLGLAGPLRQFHNIDPDDEAALAGDDGRVTGFRVRQAKTGAIVDIMLEPAIRGRVEAIFAANAKLDTPTTQLLVDDKTGRPWLKRWFSAKVAEARALAIAPDADYAATGALPHPALAELEFRDLRRTCIVTLGELNLSDALISAISGHKLESVKRILEVYMPRNSKMGARALATRHRAAQPAAEPIPFQRKA